MSLKFSSIPQKRLLAGITSASLSFYVNNILSFDGLTDVVPADLGTQHYVAFRNDTGTMLEIMEIDPATISAGPITIVRRGLSFYGDRTTETAALKLDWGANTIVMFGTDVPQIFQYLKEYIDAAAIAGAVPASTSAAGIVVEGSQAEVDAGTVTKVISAVAYKLFAPLDKIRAKKYHDYAADSVGSDAYAITITPAITAYSAGQVFTFKAGTANTGACTLNVSGLGAKAITKNYNVALSTGDIKANQLVMVQYDGTQMQLLSNKMVDLTTDVYGVTPLANLPMPAFQQAITGPIQTAGNERASGSNQSGSVIYSVKRYATTELYRYERDALTGMYFNTHSVNMTVTIPGSDYGAIIEIGIYIYVFFNDGTNIICKRYLAADLTGEQSMTVPVVPCVSMVTAWTDGVDAYVISTSSDTTSRRWTLSGTTFSAASTATCSNNLVGNPTASIYDGSVAYIIKVNTSAVQVFFSIYKLGNIDGSSITSTTSKTIDSYSDGDSSAFAAIIDTYRIYIGTDTQIYDESGVTGSRVQLLPISKP